jgi:hypothetical protein
MPENFFEEFISVGEQQFSHTNPDAAYVVVRGSG